MATPAAGIALFWGCLTKSHCSPDEITQILQSLLQQANVVSATSNVLAKIRETYPTIERQQLREVVQAMELLLEANFEEVEQENPGKTVRINLE